MEIDLVQKTPGILIKLIYNQRKYEQATGAPTYSDFFGFIKRGLIEHQTGARVYPDMFSLAIAHQAFTEDDQLSNEILAKRFETNLMAFLSLVEAAKHYPCMKKAWVEFLGEKPDPATERVE